MPAFLPRTPSQKRVTAASIHGKAVPRGRSSTGVDFGPQGSPYDPADIGDALPDDYLRRLAWTVWVLGFYVAALVLPAAGFLVVKGSSPVFILRPWVFSPGQVETGGSILFGGWIELFVVGQIGAIGWIANVLFAVVLFQFWTPAARGSQSRLLSSLAIILGLVSLPLTNLAPILADESGSKMAATAPLIGFWLWLCSMALLWVAIRVTTPRPARVGGAWPWVWTERFALIEKAGGVELPHKTALTWNELFQIRFNLFALIFGPGYYIVKGMWKKGVWLGGIQILCLVFVNIPETFGLTGAGLAWLIQGIFVFIFTTSANLDFYRLTHERGGVPTVLVRFFVLFFMALFGWTAALAVSYAEARYTLSLRESANSRSRMAPPRKQSWHKESPLPQTMNRTDTTSSSDSQRGAQAALASLPFHLGESFSEVRRTVASRPHLSAADFNADDARFAQQGLWIFFDPNQQIREIRLDPPFIGVIQGIHLGDPVSILLSTMGPPDVPVFAAAGDLAYVYHRTGVTYRFDVGHDAKVQRVFLLPSD